jgi:hypothetical protein
MKILILLAALASAAEAPKEYWRKSYLASPHKEIWTSTLAAKDPAAAATGVAAAVAAEGGRLTAPLENMAAAPDARQVSFTASKKGAAKILKRLKKLGRVAEPEKRTTRLGFEISEIREKLARLLKERGDEAEAYAKLPAASGVVDETIAHLSDAEAAWRSTEAEVLWNLTVRAAP